MPCFSPATSASASSSSRSPGRPSAWTSAGARAPCASITAPPTRSARRRTACSGPTVTDVDGNSEDRSDTVSVFNGPPPTIQLVQERKRGDRGRRRLDCRAVRRPACCRTSSACSSDPTAQLDRARGRRRRRRDCRSRFSMSTSKPPAATSRSAPCTSPRGWSSAPWR